MLPSASELGRIKAMKRRYVPGGVPGGRVRVKKPGTVNWLGMVGIATFVNRGEKVAGEPEPHATSTLIGARLVTKAIAGLLAQPRPAEAVSGTTSPRSTSATSGSPGLEIISAVCTVSPTW